MQINIAKGNQTVRIYANTEAGPFDARVYVNTRNGEKSFVIERARKL